MQAARDTEKGAPAAPIRRAGQPIRRPLVRAGLVLAALSVVCLVLPAVSAAAGGRLIVVHKGKATSIAHTSAPLRTAPPSTVVVVHKSKASSIKVIWAWGEPVAVAHGRGSGKSAVAATHRPAFAGRAAMLVLGWWGIARSNSMGNDEVATRWAALLPPHGLGHLLRNVDAVHGL